MRRVTLNAKDNKEEVKLTEEAKTQIETIFSIPLS
jgi:hypothetical protein